MKKNILFLIMFVLIGFGFSQQPGVVFYPVDVEIPSSLDPYFDQQHIRETKEYIKMRMSTAWVGAIEAYKKNKGNLDSCIKSAFDWLLANKIAATGTETVTETTPGNNVVNVRIIRMPNPCPKIIFSLEQVFLRTNSLTSSNISKPDVHGEFDSNSTDVIITLFNGFENFSLNRFKAEYKTDTYSCEYKCLTYSFYAAPNEQGTNGDTAQSPSIWSPDGSAGPFNISSAIFHELTHCALYNSGGSLESRKSDEATIEDITMKIFPGDGFNPYRYAYEFGVWKFRAMHSIVGFTYKQLFKSRNFNPPDTLKYDNPDYIDIGSIQGVYMYNSATTIPLGVASTDSCDDATCDQLVRLIIPYLRCCR